MAAEQVAFQARALAQTHALTRLAQEFMKWAVAKQVAEGGSSDIAIWASAAFLKGYCVRAVEEEEVGIRLRVPDPRVVPAMSDLDGVIDVVAASVRTGVPTTIGMEEILVADEDRLVDVLDQIVGKEVESRLDHWRDSVTAANWEELEDWITWWVVKGYATRVAESRFGALVPA